MSVPKPVGTYCHHCPGMCPGHYVSPILAKARSSLQDRIAIARGVPLNSYHLITYPWVRHVTAATPPSLYGQYIDGATYGPTPIPPPITTDAVGYDQHGEILFLFLKNVIPANLQDVAHNGLKAMQFRTCGKQSRQELRNAVKFNKHKNPPAAELNVGRYFNPGGYICEFNDTVRNRKHLPYIYPLLDHMTDWFQWTLSRQFRDQNRAIPKEFRQGGTSVYSTVTLLKSAPAAVHVDGNGLPYACMTSIAPERPHKYTGGTFCLVERGLSLAVTPGDLLIASTYRNHHCNLTPVIGTKYSVIAYFKNVLRENHPTSNILANWYAEQLNPGSWKLNKVKSK